MTATSYPTNHIEQPIIEQIDTLLRLIREPYDDVVSHVNNIEPMIDDVANTWKLAKISHPSGGLLGRARALRIEFDAIRLKLKTRGRILARVQREIQEVRGSTYGPGAQRITNTGSRIREKSL
jgi:hypothetical protein